MPMFSFLTTASVIESQATKYWVASDLVLPFDVTAPNVKEALALYIAHITQNCWADVSPSAVRNKKKMFCTINGEDVPIGYVITAHTELYDDELCKWKTVTLNLWVEIRQYRYPFTKLDK